jgi:hypothetical protein
MHTWIIIVLIHQLNQCKMFITRLMIGQYIRVSHLHKRRWLKKQRIGYMESIKRKDIYVVLLISMIYSGIGQLQMNSIKIRIRG